AQFLWITCSVLHLSHDPVSLLLGLRQTRGGSGCTHHEIKSITGHKTDAEVRRYTAKADQVLLAHSAVEKLQDTANNPKSANPL
ncbi:hypothetical protein J1C52_14265, partial [Roseibaca sp. Y0-43]|nr:hypothetical protein [Roseibaca sp. Y0-43]